jgi:hypothetical protein
MRFVGGIVISAPTLSLCVLIGIVQATAARCAEKEREKAGDIVSVNGTVLIREETDAKKASPARTAKPGDSIYAGDIINTSSSAGVKLLLKDKTVLDLGPSALFKVDEFAKGKGGNERQVQLNLSYGSLRAAVTQKLEGKSKFHIRTPTATMGVRGTIAFGQVTLTDPRQAGNGGGNSAGNGGSAPSTTFLITQGQGVVTPSAGGGSAPTITLNPGQQVTATGGSPAPQAPTTLTGSALTQRQQEVQGLSQHTDGTFQAATNFDKAMEKREQAKEQEKANNGNHNGEENSNRDGEKDKEKKDGGTQTADSGSGSGGSSESGGTSESGGETASRDPASTDTGTAPATAPESPNIMADLTGSIENSTNQTTTGDAPVVTNVPIPGAPSAQEVLADAVAPPTTPAVTSARVTVKVQWRK